jgi:arylsulfatase A-like enzyme
MAGFIESVRRLDAALGPLLGAAESAANPHGVLTLFTTGNGPAFPLMKGTLRDEGLRVAMMFAVPHLQRPTGVYDTAVAHLDIFPTLCEFLGEPAPPWLQGRSLAPLMRGEAVAVSDRIFAQMDFYACADPARCIRSAKFKLIRFFSGDSRLALANMDDSPSKTAALPLALRGWQRPKEQLFDLAADPREFRNLAALPDFQEVRLQLAAELEVWMKAQSDPLCQGVQPVPSGVELVPRDWESAQAPLCGVG